VSDKTSDITVMDPTDALTKPEFSQQLTKMTLTEPEISQTKPEIDKNKGGRPRKAPDVTPWTVRGVDLETRTAIEKAATRTGKTIGQYMNEDLRQYAQEHLKKGNQPPMKQDDLRTELDDIKGMITQLADRIPLQEKRGFFQRLFG
jgi:hypothetical protein